MAVRVLLASVLALVGAQLAIAQIPPERIFVNARVYTSNAAMPRAEAFAVAGDKFVAVGSNAAIRAIRTPRTEVVDLGGAVVIPGLIDAHGHMSGLGAFELGRIELSSAKSIDDVVAAVRERVKNAKAGEWILGGRWDHENWQCKALPTHEKLSEISPDNPVWLRRVDGHAGLANTAAMRLAEISDETHSPAGGEIIRDAAGHATGVFIDNAMELIGKHIPSSTGDAAEPLRAAQKKCLSLGLVGVHDAGCSPGDVALYQQLLERGELKMRIYCMIEATSAVAYFKANGLLIGDRLTARACKLYADGAMGSRGAWLLEPYSDRPRTEDGEPYTGLNTMKPEFLRLIAGDALQRGYQVCTHAIGDRGNRETLDAYALALSRRPTKDHRFRVEHAQLLSPQDIPRFAELGVIASMQPTHCTSDMRWIEARVGKRRAAGAYAWASLLRSGARLAGGSDFPVESPNPMLGIYAAVTRQNAEGEPAGGWRGEERMTREEALRAFTLDAAYASFEEQKRGSIEAGKWADYVVLDRDVMTCEAREILDTKVIRTVIGGEKVYGE